MPVVALVLALTIALVSTVEAAQIHFRFGLTREAEACWEREGVLYYRVQGQTYQTPKTDVLKVEGECVEPGGAQDIGRVAAKALLAGVPFISFREAARLSYEDKSAKHPSWAAAEAMILRYWGQDLTLVRNQAALARWGVATGANATTLDELKGLIARGIPVMTAPAITSVADSPNPAVVALAAMGIKRTPGSQGSPVSGQTVAQMQTVMAERTGRRAGVLGKMEPLKVFKQLADATGMTAWDTARESARVVIGYDDDRKTLIVHDPSFGPAWEVGYDDFDRMWTATRRWYAVVHPHDYAQTLARRPPATPPYPSRSADQLAAARYVRGYALASVGQVAEAEQEFDHGMALPGISPGYRHLFLFELAQLYGSRGETRRAVAAAEQAAALLPEHHRPWELLAQMHGAEGAQAKADAAQRRADAACSDQGAARAVARALAREFNVYGCEPGRLLRAD